MKSNRNLIWIAVVVSIIVVLALGIVTFRGVQTPSERSWDYGTVPFVPARSHYSDHRVPDPRLPPLDAIQPDTGDSL